MSWQALVMYCVVAGIGFLAAFRNVTAFALCAAWLFAEIVWIATGNSLPLSSYFMADVAVISIIYAKTIKRVGPKIYPTLRRQLYCLIVDLTPFDRWIVAIFMLGMWPAYVLSVDPWWKWHWLWGLAILQFLLAGAEAMRSFRVMEKPQAASDQGQGLALAGAYLGHGR